MQVETPDEDEVDDDAWPEGDLALLADLGVPEQEMQLIVNDVDLYPDEQLALIAQRGGFGDELQRVHREGLTTGESIAETLVRDALDEAKLAQAGGDVPIGAWWWTPRGGLSGAGTTTGGHRRPHRACRDPGAPGGSGGARTAGGWTGCTLAVTVEPCTMCAGAIGAARVGPSSSAAGSPRPAPPGRSGTCCGTAG